MDKWIICMVVGYLLGSFNPAALLAKKRNTDLRKKGTGNLGASNVMINFGRAMGVLVMLLDIAKAVLAGMLARWLLPGSDAAVLLAGLCAVAGHVFPFYMKFKGGKGLASFGGMILAYSPTLFLILLVVSGTVMLIVNFSVAMPLAAGFLFPVLAGLKSRSLDVFLLACAASALVIGKHWSNIARAKSGQEKKVRDYLKS